MEPQKTSNNHRSLEKEEQSWRHHTTSYQTKLKGYSNQNNIKRDTQINGTEESLYSQLIYNKGGKDSLLNK